MGHLAFRATTRGDEGLRKMKRQNVRVMFHNRVFPAEIIDGEVIGWQPITIHELNDGIDQCIIYLENIKGAMAETKEINTGG